MARSKSSQNSTPSSHKSKTEHPGETRSKSKSQRQPNELAKAEQETSQFLWKVFVVILAIAALAVSVYIQLARLVSENFISKSRIFGDTKNGNTLVVANDIKLGYLDHVVERLERFGHKIAFLNNIQDFKNTGNNQLRQYDTIWFHEYPFVEGNKFRPNQRINHFPGSGFITNKMSLSQGKDHPNKLVSFLLPNDKQEFIKHSQQHPEKLWVVKTNSHRGISVKNAQDIALSSYPSSGSLVQEFLQNPYLIDGRKFDIGIYAVLTSLEPLRAYVYNEVLVRFCSTPYVDHKTGKVNLTNLDSYVIGDDYTPIWLMKSFMRPFIGANMGMKRSLDQYIRAQGQDPSKLWKQIETTIMKVYKSKEYHMSRLANDILKTQNINSVSVKGSLNQFFEMVRFDFIVDEDLNVYLMEANMSPNLSSAHHPPNRILYEQVLNSLFNLVGLNKFAKDNMVNLPIHYIDGRLEFPEQHDNNDEERRYGLDDIIGDQELSVNHDVCVSEECHMDCEQLNCKTCYFCLDYAKKLHIRRAIYEHKNRWNFNRILPTTNPDDSIAPNVLARRTAIDANWLHKEWFREKCKIDMTYCST